MTTAFEVISAALATRFGPRSFPEATSKLDPACKAIGWSVGPTAFCVLRARKGTVVVPWSAAKDGQHYLAHIDAPRPEKRGRSTAIKRCSPLLSWKVEIAYLDVWTRYDLEQTFTIIESRIAGQPIQNAAPPEFESPSIDGNPLPLTPVFRAVMYRDGGRCVVCGGRENLHIDHVIPRARGGADNLMNLRVLCRDCNLRKSDRV